MNSTVYVFGDFGQGYTQYLDDYTRAIFKKFSKLSTAKTQLTIRREGSLIYYGYIRKLDSSPEHYIGLCSVLNSVMFTDIKSLFTLFENTIESLIVTGDILHFTTKGYVESSINSLSDKDQIVAELSKQLNLNLKSLSTNLLPPSDYTIGLDETKTFSIDDNPSDIVKASHKYGYTFVLKNEDYDSIAVKSYRGVILNLNKSLTSEKKITKKLTEENEKLLKQKKQTNVVLTLLFIIIFAGVIIWIWVADTNAEIGWLKDKISKQESVISNQETVILTQETEISTQEAHMTRQYNQILGLQSDTIKYNNNLRAAYLDLEVVKKAVSSLKDNLKNKEEETLKLKNEKAEFEKELNKLRSQTPNISPIYYTTKRSTYVGHRCGDKMINGTCSWDKDAIIAIYEITYINGEQYVLSTYGLVKMSNLKRY